MAVPTMTRRWRTRACTYNDQKVVVMRLYLQRPGGGGYSYITWVPSSSACGPGRAHRLCGGAVLAVGFPPAWEECCLHVHAAAHRNVWLALGEGSVQALL